LRVDCGEFQMEHEVAKLIGAPPGYLGHRETPPMLTQQKLTQSTSDDSALSIVLFDEIEKAAPSMNRLLLGILDKGTLRLGDNTAVNFEKTLIFLTSNLGAQGMAKALRPDFGFARRLALPGGAPPCLESIAMQAVRRKFSPEFLNRIDARITYRPLDRPSLERILDLLLEDTQAMIDRRLNARTFHLHVPRSSRNLLLERGTSQEFGARELKRTLHRELLQPVAARVSLGQIEPGALVTLAPAGEGFELIVTAAKAA
jgi:ATP-dependent Clp protease ATP-binding subunit ClpA